MVPGVWASDRMLCWCLNGWQGCQWMNNGCLSIGISIEFLDNSNKSKQMKGMSLQDTLESQDSILVKGQCRDEYYKYVQHLVLLFKNKIIQGSLLESVSIQRQIEQATRSTPTMKISLSELLQAEIVYCCVELYVKRKQKQEYKFHLQRLAVKLRKLTEAEKEYIRSKVNSLILYDHNFEVFDGLFEHPDQVAIKYYKQGRFQEAALLLEKGLKDTPTDDFNIIRRVLIGKILLQKQDLSGFSWLNYVIQTKFNWNIEKYEAKLSFISAYKVIIVDKGRNSELTTIHSLEKVLDLCFNYLEHTDFVETKKNLRVFQEIKAGITGSIENRIEQIDKALFKLGELNCYPGISIEELDLRIQLAEYLYEEEEYNRCLDETEKSKTIASQLDIYYWERELRLSKLSALSYMRLGYYQSVIEILDRVMNIEPDRVERLKCLQWKLEADKCRGEEPTANEEYEISTPNRSNARSRSLKSIKSQKSSLRSQKSNKSSNKTIETIKKEGSKVLQKHNSLDLNRELKKIRHSSSKSYQFKFKNREEIRESLRNSLEEQPKCCLLF